MSISHKLQRLFQLEDDEFVIEAFKQFLNREPEPEALSGHLELLHAGVPRINIVLGIMLGAEADYLYHLPY
ncbi:DUF4214 domain-containing protein [Paenibacillus humicola]|uniref:DUF4214 domain-containing protein n=1 Tax=Paenibacillus humicola TaxID=3110540 RepID=UPI00237B3BD4|nr:DUF4214 domain-containing protein [Paenibacillus humicola]